MSPQPPPTSHRHTVSPKQYRSPKNASFTASFTQASLRVIGIHKTVSARLAACRPSFMPHLPSANTATPPIHAAHSIGQHRQSIPSANTPTLPIHAVSFGLNKSEKVNNPAVPFEFQCSAHYKEKGLSTFYSPSSPQFNRAGFLIYSNRSTYFPCKHC